MYQKWSLLTYKRPAGKARVTSSPTSCIPATEEITRGYDAAYHHTRGYNAAYHNTRGYSAAYHPTRGYNAAYQHTRGYNAAYQHTRGYNAAYQHTHTIEWLRQAFCTVVWREVFPVWRNNRHSSFWTWTDTKFLLLLYSAPQDIIPYILDLRHWTRVISFTSWPSWKEPAISLACGNHSVVASNAGVTQNKAQNDQEPQYKTQSPTADLKPGICAHMN
jgi:hypothetical protein